MSLRVPKEHQTTIRFSDEMWEALVAAASALDVSAAQYVRDATRAQLERDGSRPGASGQGNKMRREVEEARKVSEGHAESTLALWEQGRIARERARLLREESRRRRLGLRPLPRDVPIRAKAVWESAGRPHSG